MSSVGIVGGGPAGVSLAFDLARNGHKVSVFEAAPEMGGLARSFQMGDIRIERYYHFLCGEDHVYFDKLKQVGLSDLLKWEYTKMGFFYEGVSYPFSSAFDLLQFGGMPLSSRLRYGLWTLSCSLRKDWKPLDGVKAKQWLIDRVGLDAYKATWHPLLDKKFHEYHGDISAAWIWHRIHRVSRSRKHLLAREVLGYLKGGTDSLLNALVDDAEKHGARMLNNTPVKQIHLDNYRATSIETADGTHHEFDYVVSAVPLPLFLRLAPGLPSDYRQRLEKISFVGVVCAVFRLKQRLTPNYWLNVNDSRIPFNGCIEYTNLNPDMTPDGSSIVYVPFYLPTSHERFNFSDERILSDCLHSFALINPEFSSNWVMTSAVSRDPYAQVVCQDGFALQVPPHQTPIANLMLIESSQLYPADRTVSGTFELADKVASMFGKA